MKKPFNLKVYNHTLSEQVLIDRTIHYEVIFNLFVFYQTAVFASTDQEQTEVFQNFLNNVLLSVN